MKNVSLPESWPGSRELVVLKKSRASIVFLTIIVIVFSYSGGGEAASARSENNEALLSIWMPAPGVTWQWQLSGDVDESLSVDVYDIDLFEVDSATVTSLKAAGRKTICYMSVGSVEEWRPDAKDFPAEVIGNDYNGWPGEKWLDIRQIDKLAPILRKRLDLCRDKGFDAVEPDNIDGYYNDTGFPLSAADQLAFNRWLAVEAHARGLSIGLKNDSEQASDLVSAFDWALSEDCFSQGWCEELSIFISAGKAHFAAEYTDTGIDFNAFCQQAVPRKISAILKIRDLGAPLTQCR